MTIFFTGDQHFGHASIIGHCARPFEDAGEMDTAIVDRWNAVVGPRDIVWVVGDFWIGRSADAKRAAAIFGKLAGQKHLVAGNHDGAVVRRLPWASIREIGVIKVDRQVVVACHYPMRTWPHAAHGAIHVYGHVHGALKDTNKSVDVGVDRWDFTPVTLEQIRARMAVSQPSPDYPEAR